MCGNDKEDRPGHVLRADPAKRQIVGNCPVLQTIHDKAAKGGKGIAAKVPSDAIKAYWVAEKVLSHSWEIKGDKGDGRDGGSEIIRQRRRRQTARLLPHKCHQREEQVGCGHGKAADKNGDNKP